MKTVARLVADYEAAQQRLAELAAELARALALPTPGRQPRAPRVPDAPSATPAPARPNGASQRILGHLRAGPLSTHDLADRLGLTRVKNVTDMCLYMSRRQTPPTLRQLPDGRYALADSNAAFVDVLKEAASAPAKGKKKKMPRKGEAVHPESIVGRTVHLAEQRGGTIDIAAMRAAGLGYFKGRKKGGAEARVLGEAANRGLLVRLGKGIYVTPAKAAELRTGKSPAAKPPDPPK